MKEKKLTIYLLILRNFTQNKKTIEYGLYEKNMPLSQTLTNYHGSSNIVCIGSGTKILPSGKPPIGVKNTPSKHNTKTRDLMRVAEDQWKTQEGMEVKRFQETTDSK